MEIGEVTNYFEHVKAAAIKLTKPLKIGDTIQIKGGEIEFEQKVTSIQLDRKSITQGKKGDEIGIKVSQKVRRGYKVLKK